MRTITVFVLMLMCSATAPLAQHHQHASKYAGQEVREIKSLSADDMEELKRGGGWGLAKAAELNGVPGPIHLLELKSKIPLSPEQVASLTKVYEEMRQQAVKLGGELIDLERKLDQSFQKRSITDSSLHELLREISRVRMQLRYAHLAAHLKTPKILSEAQIARYNQLRGYGQKDPCASVPARHNPAMWRKHHGCN